jgi:hypothetical protein
MSFTEGPALDLRIGQERAVRSHDHPEVVRLALGDRPGQRPEVGLPGFVLLAQPLEVALDERRPLAQMQLDLFPCHGHFLFGRF